MRLATSATRPSSSSSWQRCSMARSSSAVPLTLGSESSRERLSRATSTSPLSRALSTWLQSQATLPSAAAGPPAFRSKLTTLHHGQDSHLLGLRIEDAASGGHRLDAVDVAAGGRPVALGVQPIPHDLIVTLRAVG